MALTDYYVTDAGAGSANGSSIANAMSYATFTDYMVTGGSFTAAPGDRFNIIGAITSRTTTTDTWVNGGNATSPVVVRGWTSGGTNPYVGRTNGNGPLITTNFPTIPYTTGRLVLTGTFIQLENLYVTGTTGTSSLIALANNCSITRSYASSSGTNVNSVTVATSGSTSVVVADCDITQTGASGGATALSILGAGTRAFANRVTSVSGAGITCRSSAVIEFNTVYNCGTVGISMDSTTGTPFIAYNTIYGCVGDGIDIITGTTSLQCIFGNMLTDNGGYGVDFNNAAIGVFVAYNRTRDNTSGAYNLATDWVAATSFGDVTTDTGGPSTDYVNAGTLDLNLISASPATSASLPQFASMGALQRSQTGGGGGQRSYVTP